ncbi:MAG: hypothetical protein V4649_15755 [Bacteroidota bacterium]
MFHKVSSDETIRGGRFYLRGGVVFALLWLVTFCLYFPAARAGFVADFTGWLDQVQNHSFLENLNRTNYKVRSLYQFTQLSTYIFYKLFGTSVWLWHLLFVTMHVINAFLLYTLVLLVLEDNAVKRRQEITLAGALLFCITPYASEVIVWEPSYHFLQGLMMILLILLLTRLYSLGFGKKYAIAAVLIYFISTFSLEVFYVTPFLVLGYALYVRYGVSFTGSLQRRIVLKHIFVPMLLLLAAHFVTYRVVYGTWVAHISSDNTVGITLSSFGKPAKYLFHLFFVGRFFPHEIKQAVYAFCDSAAGIAIFYLTVLTIGIDIARKLGTMSRKARVTALLFVWMLITLLLLVPLWFQDILLVLHDRYLYFTCAFFYMLFAVLVFFIPFRAVRLGILVIFGLVNLRYAVQASRYWGKSEKVIAGLLNSIPDEKNRTVILLNMPQSMHGVAMIGAEQESEYQLMHNLLRPQRQLHTTVHDAMAYNMDTPTDGANAIVINDSTIKVTLNQWGTWWWYEARGGKSYENGDYKLDLKDPGHYYELTLKKPAAQFLLLYQVGNQWKVVDWDKKNEEQR